MAPRLTLSDPTLKTLFALSGNQCAFPTCTSPIIDELGQVIAQVAHIVGVAEKNTARPNPGWKPEQLSHPSNLLILCYRHHIATNDDSVWTVAKMQAMKEEHERRFAGVVERLGEYEDVVAATRYAPPSNLNRLIGDYPMPASSNPLGSVLSSIESWSRLPVEFRSIFAQVVELGDADGDARWSADENHVWRHMGSPRRAQFDEDVSSLIRLGILHRDAQEIEGGPGDGWVLTTSGSLDQFESEDVRFLLLAALFENVASAQRMFVTLDWRFLEG